VAGKKPKKREARTELNDQCLRCGAKCCQYFALPIDDPADRKDFDDIRWYLLHEGVSIFVEDGDWYIQIDNRCKALTAEGLCSVYENRPRICRKYKDGECEFAVPDGEHEVLLRTPEECTAYADKVLAEKKARKKRKRSRKKGSKKG